MPSKMLQITYKLSASISDYREENLPYAKPIAEIPGLQWKIWIVNEKRSEAGGIYAFVDEKAIQAFLDGPIIAEMKGDPTLQIRMYDVIDGLSRATRGPVD
jgi:hypothetical protein